MITSMKQAKTSKRNELGVIAMSLKSDAYWTMSRRYQKAVETEKDLSEAEKLVVKVVEYYDKWQKAVQ